MAHSLKARLRGTLLYRPLKALAAGYRSLEERWRRERRIRRMRRFYAQFIKPGDLTFDVGANVGSRTGIFLQLGASVVSVEPQKECARTLFFSFHANPNFHLVNKALGAANGRREMVSSNYSTTASLSRAWIDAAKPASFQDISWGGPRQVPVTTLDSLIQEYGLPTFVKIDAEGFEYEIMQGLSRPLVALSLEFIPTYLGPALQSINYLKRFGPLRLNYALEERFEWVLDEWVTPDEIIAILEKHGGAAESIYGDVYVRFIEA